MKRQKADAVREALLSTLDQWVTFAGAKDGYEREVVNGFLMESLAVYDHNDAFRYIQAQYSFAYTYSVYSTSSDTEASPSQREARITVVYDMDTATAFIGAITTRAAIDTVRLSSGNGRRSVGFACLTVDGTVQLLSSRQYRNTLAIRENRPGEV